MEPSSHFASPQSWVIIAVGICVFVVFALASIGSAIWAALDAGKRGKSSPLVGVAVLLTWPIGLIVWLCLRPESRTPLSDPATAPPADSPPPR